jgi:hypothetical protein
MGIRGWVEEKEKGGQKGYGIPVPSQKSIWNKNECFNL